MGLKLFEVQQDDEFKELFHVFRAGFTNPGTKLWPLFTADYRSDPALEETTLKETTPRLISWHDPTPPATGSRSSMIALARYLVVAAGRSETGNLYGGHGDMEASW